jgi:hypothetical protein
MNGAAACVARNQEVVKNFFCLFMRDDLVSFHATRLVFQSDPDCQRLELQLRDRISANVRQILKRDQNFMPSPQQPADGQRVCVVFCTASNASSSLFTSNCSHHLLLNVFVSFNSLRSHHQSTAKC